MPDFKEPTPTERLAFKIMDAVTGEKRAPRQMSTAEFIAHFAHGYLMQELKNEIWLYQISHRAIVPIINPIPHQKNKGIKKGNFSFTTNQAFTAVLEECAIPRKREYKGRPPRGAWIGPKIKNFFIQAHSKEHCSSYPYFRAHSIEAWRDKELVGGGIFLQMGAAIVSISIFTKYDSAGNAVGVFLQHLLLQGSMKVHDSGLITNFSDFLNGQLVTNELAREMRVKVIEEKLDLPTISIPVAYSKISQIRKDLSGHWTIPEQEYPSLKEPPKRPENQMIETIMPSKNL